MNRTLRRPMFRIGGVAEGITSGLSRQGYATNEDNLVKKNDFSKMKVSDLGNMNIGQLQAEEDAKREANRMALYEPMERMGYIGSGLSGLMQGMGPQYQFGTQPNASPLATALGIGTTLGGIYGNVIGPQNPKTITSDVRLKTDIEPIGKSSSGVNVYSFKYKGDDKTYQGVMAQEVPWASIVGNDGYLKVDYSKVDVEFKRIN